MRFVAARTLDRRNIMDGRCRMSLASGPPIIPWSNSSSFGADLNVGFFLDVLSDSPQSLGRNDLHRWAK